MTNEEKSNILKAIDAFDVSYIRTPNEIIYDIENPDGILMSISALLYINQKNKPTIQYAIETNDKIIEAYDVEQGLPISADAQNVIDIMKKCARKVMFQQTTLLQNKYMHHMAHSSKEYN